MPTTERPVKPGSDDSAGGPRGAHDLVLGDDDGDGAASSAVPVVEEDEVSGHSVGSLFHGRQCAVLVERPVGEAKPGAVVAEGHQSRGIESGRAFGAPCLRLADLLGGDLDRGPVDIAGLDRRRRLQLCESSHPYQAYWDHECGRRCRHHPPKPPVGVLI